MTSARLEAIQARRELAFLEICEGYQDRLEAARAALRQARESGDQDVIEQARTAHRAVSNEMHEFRAWARTTGKPREGTPGRDAVIRVGA